MGIDRFEAGIIFDGKNQVIGFVKEDDGDIVSYKQHLESHAYDEAKERELFEAYAKTVNDKVNLKIYTAAEGYIYVCGNYKDVSVQTSWLTWLACAKSRAGIQS